MEILNILYKSKKIIVIEDGYGGSPSWKYFYSYILFKNKECYIFYSIKPFEIIGRLNYEKLKPIESFDDSKTIKNIDLIIKNASHSEYKKNSGGKAIFSLPVQIADGQGEIIEVNRIYSAVLQNEGKLLRLKAFDESKPDVLVIDSEFERIEINSVF
jgi:hypothetical protein